MEQQHANWISQARAHWKENRPAMFARLEKNGLLEEALSQAARSTSSAMQTLMRQGQTWEEAWEEVRELYLFPAEEPSANEPIPPSEGFKANSARIQGLDSLTMPGEKTQE